MCLSHNSDFEHGGRLLPRETNCRKVFSHRNEAMPISHSYCQLSILTCGCLHRAFHVNKLSNFKSSTELVCLVGAIILFILTTTHFLINWVIQKSCDDRENNTSRSVPLGLKVLDSLFYSLPESNKSSSIQGI